MTPQQLLQHHDNGLLWSPADRVALPEDLPSAYRQALAVRQLRLQRGERPCGYKIGFTNRTIWPLYNVFAPIWGTVWEGGLSFCEGEGEMDLAATCQPRIEPEIVFGLRASPARDASPEDLFDALDWLAPGVEVVQSHCPDWRFAASETVTDGGLHARLLVGPRIAVREIASSAAELNTLLASAQVTLLKNGTAVAQGQGVHVLGSPLLALHHFLRELRQCPDATDLQPGDVVTTGTWTDAFPIAPGERWSAQFSSPLHSLSMTFG
ncbi:MAG: fumarylacetoacetate hydrolase family protein [Hydrogenophaga sp.]|jgi:2-oxo-3-hexenedioate decarboxylase|nr:fumarylacetoacetate hydrolase family protein [Hydrogenophaga sp.]